VIRFRLRRHASNAELAAYVDGNLSPAERSRVVSHLDGCNQCRALAAELREGTVTLAGVLPPFPAELLTAGLDSLLAATMDCQLGPETLSTLFGSQAPMLSCRMVDELLGAGAVPV
jgi:anti-sigma factor RsiW